ncbi:hypothetical protein D3C72_887330 [compost metagenome]
MAAVGRQQQGRLCFLVRQAGYIADLRRVYHARGHDDHQQRGDGARGHAQRTPERQGIAEPGPAALRRQVQALLDLLPHALGRRHGRGKFGHRFQALAPFGRDIAQVGVVVQPAFETPARAPFQGAEHVFGRQFLAQGVIAADIHDASRFARHVRSRSRLRRIQVFTVPIGSDICCATSLCDRS